MMTELSDDEHDIDIESDEDEGGSPAGGMNFLSDAEKKAHHNALERRRRDHIKESFLKLRDAIPDTKKEKTSRALILKKAHEYIKHMNHKALAARKEIEKMRRQNMVLRQQKAAERAQSNGSFVLPDDLVPRNQSQDYDQSESSDGSENGDMRNGQDRQMTKARF